MEPGTGVSLSARLNLLKTHPTWDVIIIGGGIAGCGIARDAARRGLTVLLLDKNDFGSGTTARSSRLIHGGIRYLEQYHFRLVREALQEREILLSIAPHLVRPLCFLLPVYRGYRRGPWALRVGLWLYDLLSWGKSLPNHQKLSKEALLRAEPSLKADNLLGGFAYYDAQCDFPERLCIENVMDAYLAGTYPLNYCEVLEIRQTPVGIVEVTFQDKDTREVFVAKGRTLVNAGGPWVEEILGLMNAASSPRARLTRGTHLVLPRFVHHALLLLAHKDGRVFFTLPWRSYCLVGTTDVDHQGTLEDPMPSQEEVQYLLNELQAFFQDPPIHQIYFTMAGLRPLVHQEKGSPSSLSRDYLIIHHESEGFPNFYTVIGVKITTYRAVAEQMGDLLAERLEVFRKSDTANHPLPGGEDFSSKEELVESFSRHHPLLPLDSGQWDHLVSLYGTRVGRIVDLMVHQPELAQRIHPDHPDLWAQVLYGLQYEFVRRTGDFLLRRTGIGLSRGLGEECAEAVARFIGKYLNRSEKGVQQDLKEYYEQVERRRYSPIGEDFSKRP